MLSLLVMTAVSQISLTDSTAVRRVHVLVDAETRNVELVRVNAVRSAYVAGYVATAVDADRLCRGRCELDVDVDPRLDYVLRVEDEDVRAVDLTAHGDSVVVKVTPPSTGLRGAGTALLVGGIVSTALGGATSLLSVLTLWTSSYSYSSSRPTLLGVDSSAALAVGLGAVAVGVTCIIVGAIMKRHAVMEVDMLPGTVAPRGTASQPGAVQM